MEAPATPDREAWLVYSDWLVGRGEPRGAALAALLRSARAELATPIDASPLWFLLCRWTCEPFRAPRPETDFSRGLARDARVEAELATVCRAASVLFSIYQRPARLDFCEFCYGEAEIATLQRTPLAELDDETARRLTWEVSDHWPSVAAYKHFLPRMLTALAPPDSVGVLTVNQFFDALVDRRFAEWPDEERLVVRRFVRAMEALWPVDQLDEWRQHSARLDPEPKVFRA